MKKKNILRIVFAICTAAAFSFTAYFYRNIESFYRWPDLEFLHFKKV